MEVSLQYAGPLSASNRNGAKQRLRAEFSPQLLGFCKSLRPTGSTIAHPFYWFSKPIASGYPMTEATIKGNRIVWPSPIGMPQTHCFVRLGNYVVVPIITRGSNLSASVHIHMYRRDDPGGIIMGGDLDNRLKTLFDALRMPHSLDELPHEDPGPDPRLLCLLEDDSLITEITIETHRLFTPPAGTEAETDVRLSVHVDIVAPRHPTL